MVNINQILDNLMRKVFFSLGGYNIRLQQYDSSLALERIEVNLYQSYTNTLNIRSMVAVSNMG